MSLSVQCICSLCYCFAVLIVDPAKYRDERLESSRKVHFSVCSSSFFYYYVWSSRTTFDGGVTTLGVAQTKDNRALVECMAQC